MASPLVRVAFAAVALATIVAFFVTQQLKSEFPLVLRFVARPAAISPNGDDYQDSARVGFDLTERARVSFSVVDGEGNEVRRIVDSRDLPGDRRYRLRWDGRDDSGRIVPDGVYRLRIVRRDEGRVINSIKEIRVDTVPPRVRLLSARPGVIAAGAPGQRPRVLLRYAGPRNFAPEVRVFRTDRGPARVVLRFRGNNRREAVWDGSVRGHPAAEGDYAFTFRVRDAAGNVTVAPAGVPSAANAARGTGVSVRRLTLSGPLRAVRPGALLSFDLGPYDRSFDFRLTRLGLRRPARKGGRIGGRFRVRVPRDAHTGLYVLRVRAGSLTAEWPLTVAGRSQRRRPLVVLPAMTWQGLNQVDDDLDGFADTLDRSRAVRLDRGFSHGRLPARLRSQAAPLLRFLDRAKLRYDLTTDWDLARRQGPPLEGSPGVLLAGDSRWLPPALLRQLRDYVRGGGRLALFGAESLRRSATLRGASLVDPGRRRVDDLFGERTSLLRTSDAPLAAERDELGLFGSVDRFFGSFSVFEIAPHDPANTLAAAGRDPGRPAFVAFRVGRGVVVRAGTPQWARELRESALDVEVPRVTRRIWRLLARGSS